MSTFLEVFTPEILFQVAVTSPQLWSALEQTCRYCRASLQSSHNTAILEWTTYVQTSDMAHWNEYTDLWCHSLNLKYGHYSHRQGTLVLLNGELHCEDGPAIRLQFSGTYENDEAVDVEYEEYRHHGLRHRLGQPAVTRVVKGKQGRIVEVVQDYWEQGQRHRIGAAATIYWNRYGGSTESYFQRGKFLRYEDDIDKINLWNID